MQSFHAEHMACAWNKRQQIAGIDTLTGSPEERKGRKIVETLNTKTELPLETVIMEYSARLCTLIRKLSISCCPEGKEQDGGLCWTCLSLTLMHKEDMRRHRSYS